MRVLLIHDQRTDCITPKLHVIAQRVALSVGKEERAYKSGHKHNRKFIKQKITCFINKHSTVIFPSTFSSLLLVICGLKVYPIANEPNVYIPRKTYVYRGVYSLLAPSFHGSRELAAQAAS